MFTLVDQSSTRRIDHRPIGCRSYSSRGSPQWPIISLYVLAMRRHVSTERYMFMR